ncbi:MAG TPA: prolipoprotein diacylglyceryl transferase [Chloroflexi bacterium]|nr:prolipoprotein diacylglyceryl transferase [Chloroflexota bacterium]
MDPIIFTIPGTNFSLHWYGVIMAVGIILAGLVAEWGVRQRGEDGEHIWELLIWAVPFGIIGARLWYVVNDMLGGGKYYIDNPLQILNLPQGGLHFYGAVLFGALGALIFVKRNQLDFRIFLDAAAPALLIGQALVRPANFINQELYGQPTDLPWGIRIDAVHRIGPWTNMFQYPYETTFFHPTFAYEMLWNFLAAGILLWIALEFKKRIKPASIFAGWLVLEGFGREIIEFFRPDQPRLGSTDISYSRIVAGVMILAGIIWLLVKYEIIKLPFLKPGPAAYQLSSKAQASKEE